MEKNVSDPDHLSIVVSYPFLTASGQLTKVSWGIAMSREGQRQVLHTWGTLASSHLLPLALLLTPFPMLFME